ncbi:hypothetical protein HDU81_002875 [Chytriomyces hyalinus]|nr:hypothetical protein HDU81_002875 [Chytriomyces hyalinus]
MTSTQVFKSRGVGTAGAQTYDLAYSGWTPTSAIYLSGPDPGHIWWFGHKLYDAKDIRPVGGNCYQIAAFYVFYYTSRQTTTLSTIRTTTRLTISTTLSMDSDSSVTATTAALSSTTIAAPSTRTTLPSELSISKVPRFNEGVFTGTVYTDTLDNSTFAVVCAINTIPPYDGTPNYYIFAYVSVVVVVVVALSCYSYRQQHKFWSTHSATISVAPGGGRHVVVGSTDPQYIAMLQQQQEQQPVYATTSPGGYGQPANVPSGSYPVYAQSQSSDGKAGLSSPAPAYGQYN